MSLISKRTWDPTGLLNTVSSLWNRLASGSTAKIVTEKPDTMFRDFKYKFTPATPESVEQRFQGLVQEEQERPLVFVFGWAGASDKNLDKYSEIYRMMGCDTFAYYLPTRFIFSSTAEVPHVSKRVLDIVEDLGLMNRPIFFHNLSDTGNCDYAPCYENIMPTHMCLCPGLMMYQVMHKVLSNEGRQMNIRGNIMDSSPGRRPLMTVSRVSAVSVVNYLCGVRDGMSRYEALSNTYL
jgi:hypothetical protein